jgi:hypothetical protein
MSVSEYDEPYPNRNKKSKLWLILLLAIGIPVGLLLSLVTLGVLFYATAKDLPLSDADREIVPTAAYIADWFDDFDPTIGTETWIKKRFLDGSVDVDYTYDHAEEAEEGTYIWLSCTVTIERKRSDARISYEAGSAGSSIGLGIGGVKRRERKDLFSWGEKSRCAILVGEVDQPVGNHFICLTGNTVFEWVVVGVYFDDSEVLAEVLEPILARLATYEP